MRYPRSEQARAISIRYRAGVGALARTAGLLLLALGGCWTLSAGPTTVAGPSLQSCRPAYSVEITIATDAQGVPTGQVTLFAQPATSNALQWVQFNRAANAFISIHQQSYYNVPFRYYPPAGTTQLTFFVTAQTAGASMVELVVTDNCGAWSTLVGTGGGTLNGNVIRFPLATLTPTPTATPTATVTPSPRPTATPLPPSMSIRPTNIGAGARVTLYWNNVPNPTPRDWIGLYIPGTADTAPIGNVRAYTNGLANGALVWDLPYHPAGDPYPDDYEFRLFTNDTHQRITTLYFTLPVRLSFSPSAVPRRGQTTITWSGLADPSVNDWVGLFPIGGDDRYPLTFTRLTGSSSGSVSLYIPVNITENTYQIRLFDAGNQRLATENPFEVQSGAALTAPLAGRAGDLMLVSWAVYGQSEPGDRIGLYSLGAPDDQAHELAATTIGTACTGCAGSVYFGVPSNLLPGWYEFKLFAAGGFYRLASTGPVHIFWSTPEITDGVPKYYKSHVDYEYFTSLTGQITHSVLGRWYAGQLGGSASWWRRHWVRDYDHPAHISPPIRGWGIGPMWGNDGWWYYEGGELGGGFIYGGYGIIELQLEYQDRFTYQIWCSYPMQHDLRNRISVRVRAQVCEP